MSSVDVGAIQRELAMCKLPFYKGTYGAGTTQVAAGIDTHPGPTLKKGLDEREAAGEKVIVWLGSFDRAVPGDFERGDDWIRQNIAPIAGHPAILAYQVTDEANGSSVANAADRMRARRDVINAADPSKPTYVTLATSGADWSLFNDVADLFGLVAYPCSTNKQHKAVYSETKIPTVIQRAKDAGLPAYGAVMQLFKDNVGFYRIPTPTELQHQFDQWEASDWKGYMLYHWGIADVDNLPDHVAVITQENATL